MNEVLLGSVMIGLGTFALWSRADAVATLVALTAALLLCAGATALLVAWTGRSSSRLAGPAGVASIALGVATLAWPSGALEALAVLSGAGVVVAGVCVVVWSLADAAGEPRAVALVLGVTLAGLGILEALHPTLAGWVLAVLVALLLVGQGTFAAGAGLDLLRSRRGAKSATARVRGSATQRTSEPDELRHLWGIAECAVCGTTLVAGEPSGRRAGEVVCTACYGAAPAPSTWIAAPACSSRRPVRLVDGRSRPAERRSEPSRAA